MGRRRVLLFCHDGKGLGHLRRISRIAAALQKEFACLIVTGMTDAQWLIPPGCELLKLPNWDAISAERALRRGQASWLDLSVAEATSFRSQLIESAGAAFNPDAILVDYLPFGFGGELRALLSSSSARKYLIHRGLSDYADRHVLRGEASRAIAQAYDRIVVTADAKISDVVREYDFVEPAIEKVVYAGYIRPPTCAADPAAIRGRPRIVCSCGGGVGGEQMLSACAQAAASLPEFDFELVLGPHGALRPGLEAALADNCTLTRVHPDLTALHQSACVVVTHGGYNSVMESVSGGARILVFHIQGDSRDERIHFEQRLTDHYPIRSVANLNCLAQEIGVEVDQALRWGKAPFDLNFNGLVHIAELLRADTRSIHVLGNPEPLASPARPIGFDSPQVPIRKLAAIDLEQSQLGPEPLRHDVRLE